MEAVVVVIGISRAGTRKHGGRARASARTRKCLLLYLVPFDGPFSVSPFSSSQLFSQTLNFRFEFGLRQVNVRTGQIVFSQMLFHHCLSGNRNDGHSGLFSKMASVGARFGPRGRGTGALRRAEVFATTRVAIGRSNAKRWVVLLVVLFLHELVEHVLNFLELVLHSGELLLQTTFSLASVRGSLSYHDERLSKRGSMRFGMVWGGNGRASARTKHEIANRLKTDGQRLKRRCRHVFLDLRRVSVLFE